MESGSEGKKRKMTSGIFLKTAAVVLACVGGGVDLKTHKIPNRLTVPGMLLGIILNFIFGGVGNGVNSLAGIGVGFLAFVLFAIGGLKAGDVKLYMAIGAFGGWRFSLETMIASILIGGLAAFFVMLMRKSGWKMFKNLWTYLINMIYIRKFYMYQAENESSYFSFGCCIALGAGVALVRYMW